MHGDVASYDPGSASLARRDVFATEDGRRSLVGSREFNLRDERQRLRGGFIRSNVPSISREPASTCDSPTNPIRHFASQQRDLSIVPC